VPPAIEKLKSNEHNSSKRFQLFTMINDLIQREPADALDPEIMGSLAAIGIVKGQPFNPDDRMWKILTDAAAPNIPPQVLP
jgi:hypothetical protein